MGWEYAHTQTQTKTKTTTKTANKKITTQSSSDGPTINGRSFKGRRPQDNPHRNWTITMEKVDRNTATFLTIFFAQ